MPHVCSPNRLDPTRSGLLVIDVQEKLCPLIPSAEHAIGQMNRLVEVGKLLSIPMAATVQYPKGLGPLVPSLAQQFPTPEEKVTFSAAVCRTELDRWTSEGRDQIVLVGIETHVCVQQTVLDLLAEGLRTFVVADAVAARHQSDHEIALCRMRDCGATVTTVESVMFEWVGSADRPEFKAVSNIIKSKPSTG